MMGNEEVDIFAEGGGPFDSTRVDIYLSNVCDFTLVCPRCYTSTNIVNYLHSIQYGNNLFNVFFLAIARNAIFHST